MQSTIVGVLRGGPSKKHDVSLKTGHAIISNLPQERFLARDIYIDKQGVWHERGLASNPTRILRGMDVVLIGMHGKYGEDGEVQKILERAGVPYAGANSFGSFLAMHKVLAKEKAREAGLLTPLYKLFEKGKGTVETFVTGIIRSFHQPVVVKPVRSGSVASIVGGYAPVLRAVKTLLEEGTDNIIVEEFVRGREASVGIVEGLRGEKRYTTPITERTAGGYLCPAHLSRVQSEDVMTAARRMHQALGLRHYSHSEFIFAPKGIYYLKTSTLPSLSEESLLPQSLAAVGIPFPDFLTHLVDLALAR